MKPLTKEWVEKAEGDFVTALRELRARKSPNFDSACFHSQQCAEKYVKARLQEASLPVPYIHDLEILINLALPLEPLWAVLLPEAKSLSRHGVRTRYPGTSMDKAQAQAAIKLCKEFRSLARQSLGLPI